VGLVLPFKPRRPKPQPTPASAATRPNKPAKRSEDASVVYRAVEGWPIHWRYGSGIVHACEATEIHPGCMLSWTICGKEVHDDATYVSRDLEEVSCPVCALDAAGRKGRLSGMGARL